MQNSSIAITAIHQGRSYRLIDISGCPMISRLKMEATASGPFLLFAVKTDNWISTPPEKIYHQAKASRDLAVMLLRRHKIQFFKNKHYKNLYFVPRNPDDISRIMDMLSWPEEVQRPILKAYQALKEGWDYPDLTGEERRTAPAALLP